MQKSPSSGASKLKSAKQQPNPTTDSNLFKPLSVDTQSPKYKIQTNTVMKNKLTYSLILAAASCGMALGQTTAYTTPVGYYEADIKAGGNLFVPGFVNGAAFAGLITGSTATTLSVAAASITANAFNAAGGNATHYVQITQAGANQGVVIDIASNTNSVITLASNISALSLAGTESIVVRPHVTLKGVFAGEEASIASFSDSATFYNSDGSTPTFFFDGTNWTSDFVNPDGNNRPVPPGTGFVFTVSADIPLTITGEVNAAPVVVQLNGNGVVNVVGPVNPLVGGSDTLQSLGFAALAAFSDSITLYQAGTVIPTGTYFSDGTNVTEDFVNPSSATLASTTGGVVTAGADTSIKVDSGFTVAP